MQVLCYNASPICKSVEHSQHMSCPYWACLSQWIISWDVEELRHKQYDKNNPTPLALHLFSSSSFASLIEGQASEAEKCRFKWSKMLMSPALMCVSFKSKIELDGWWWEVVFTVSWLLRMGFVKDVRVATKTKKHKHWRQTRGHVFFF